MSHVPSEDLAEHIEGQVGSLTVGTNLFASTMRAPTTGIPENAVFVWDAGGPAPLRTMSEPDEIRRALVAVQIRNEKHGTGIDLAYSIQNSVRADAVATYLDLVAANAGPTALGQDLDGNHIFSLFFMMVYQEP